MSGSTTGDEALYERYKEALKRGHVASLRGRLEDALRAYAEAASIAPERPTPHTSAGTALVRQRRFADALRAYEAALAVAPRDETAMLGRAQVLTALGRRPEAADAFDALAEQCAAAGRLADAVDAARRGLELAEGRERRRTLERLIGRLRATEPGEPGRLALERALSVLDGSAIAGASRPGGGSAGGGPAQDGAVEPVAEAGPEAPDGPEAPEDLEAPQAPGAPQALEASQAAGAPAAPEDLPAPVPSALDRDLPPGAGLDQLAQAAEDAVDAGETTVARDRLLDLASASHARGHRAAALDACYLALSLDPDDVGLHLALVQLYDDQGWSALATEKIELLDRLVGLDGDPDAAARVAAARAARAR